MAPTPLQQRCFRDVVVNPRLQGRGNRSLRQALEVMELWWERGSGGAPRGRSLGWDWERAMREQGRMILLVGCTRMP
jgi:hypothetical protein